MTHLKVSSKYQITIPKDLRQSLGIEAGDHLYVAREGGKLVLLPFPKVVNPTEKLYGSVRSDRDAVEAVREFRKAGGRA